MKIAKAFVLIICLIGCQRFALADESKLTFKNHSRYDGYEFYVDGKKVADFTSPDQWNIISKFPDGAYYDVEDVPGIVLGTANIKNEKLNGTFYLWYPDTPPKPQEITNYVDDKLDGDQTFYKSDGSVQMVLHWQNGVSLDAQAAAEFKNVAEHYVSLKKKPKLSPEARKFAVQANDAMDQKQFDNAASLYQQALAIAPWWPQGHYNEAEILGESGKNYEAIQEMKKYLMLEPKAKDAQTAQDEISKWEGRAGQ